MYGLPFIDISFVTDTSVDLQYDNKDIHVSLIPNPSHLEVNIYTIKYRQLQPFPDVIENKKYTGNLPAIVNFLCPRIE